MKTSDLVQLLAADQVVEPAPAHSLARALLPGVAVALVVFIALAGWRADVLASLAEPRFVFKLLLNLAAAVAACGFVLRLARPLGGSGPWPLLLLGLAALLLGAVVLELLVLPREQWWDSARGSNATWCLRLIPALSAGPLVATLWVLRRSAPARPWLAGLAAGLMSAGIGGLLYATHCPDDSPLFVVLWYGLATLIVATAGALAGARLLRW